MPFDRNELEILGAKLAAGMLNGQDIFEFADQLTSEGQDDRAIVDIVVAGKDAFPAETAPLMRTFLEQAGIRLPDAESACADLAFRYANRAVLGLMTGREASKLMPVEPVSYGKQLLDLSIFRKAVIHGEDLDDSMVERSLKHLCSVFVHDFENAKLKDWRQLPAKRHDREIQRLFRQHQ